MQPVVSDKPASKPAGAPKKKARRITAEQYESGTGDGVNFVKQGQSARKDSEEE